MGEEKAFTTCGVALAHCRPLPDGPCENLGMQDRELYRRILGIEAPWQVERVELKLESGEVHIYLDHPKM
jgi:hypothetical protein